MGSFTYSKLCLGLLIILMTTMSSPASAQLSTTFYATTCPSVFDTVRTAVRAAINGNIRNGPTILRLFFHDCFVNGCDGSILLDDTGSFVGEKTAPANANFGLAFNAIDAIKTQVDRACGSPVVSCADIVAIATRDSIVELGGPSYSVPVGRRDARTTTLAATSDIPAFSDSLETLLGRFDRKGFTPREMVALSGAHTVGQATCVTFRDRIYSQTNIDPAFATMRQATCPRNPPNGNNNPAPLDDPQNPNRFDNNYFQALMNRRGLLNSDQVLFNGSSTDSLVTMYSNDPNAFSTDFANAMVKLGNVSPLTGTQGEVRVNCRRIN